MLVCSLYASLSAYIFTLSALLLSQTVFLYALYAVFFGVVFLHSMHSRFFDAYNAYKSQTSGWLCWPSFAHSLPVCHGLN